MHTQITLNINNYILYIFIYIELFKSLYVLHFYDLKKYKIPIFRYKVYHKALPMTILMIFTQYHSNYQTRQSIIFYVMQERIRSKGVLYILEHAFGIQ